MMDKKIGIIGTGFIASGIFRLLEQSTDWTVSKILTRRPEATLKNFPQERLTHEVDELIAHSDLVVEGSGDAIYATAVLEKVLEAGVPVVTMNSELQLTTGSYLGTLGYITEAHGDQPGCLAQLNREVRSAGFNPLVYGNIKGFLNLNPSRQDMEYWSQKQGLRLDQTVSFTDGSKLQIEQALVANGLGAAIACDGMLGLSLSSLEESDELVSRAQKSAHPLSDYVLYKGSPPGVFILAESREADRQSDYGPFARLRTRGGSAYIFLRPFHLCYLEIPRTITEVFAGTSSLLTNSPSPRYNVAAIAKRKLLPGEYIARGLGSFDVRGEAVSIAKYQNHLPLCLLENATVKTVIEPGQMLSFADVELPETRALQIYKQINLGNPFNSFCNSKNLNHQLDVFKESKLIKKMN